jgi:hypothetical protein
MGPLAVVSFETDPGRTEGLESNDLLRFLRRSRTRE